jgi:hypothetical protein
LLQHCNTDVKCEAQPLPIQCSGFKYNTGSRYISPYNGLNKFVQARNIWNSNVFQYYNRVPVKLRLTRNTTGTLAWRSNNIKVKIAVQQYFAKGIHMMSDDDATNAWNNIQGVLDIRIVQWKIFKDKVMAIVIRYYFRLRKITTQMIDGIVKDYILCRDERRAECSSRRGVDVGFWVHIKTQFNIPDNMMSALKNMIHVKIQEKLKKQKNHHKSRLQSKSKHFIRSDPVRSDNELKCKYHTEDFCSKFPFMQFSNISMSRIEELPFKILELCPIMERYDENDSRTIENEYTTGSTGADTIKTKRLVPLQKKCMSTIFEKVKSNEDEINI